MGKTKDPSEERAPRLAVRAIIVEAGRLLLVNAFRDPDSNLWIAPGGGVIRGTGLPENLAREVWEETGLRIAVGALAAVREFANSETGFHQVEMYFYARIVSGQLDPSWEDPEGVVRSRGYFDREALAGLRMTPDFLRDLAFDPGEPARYRGLDRMLSRKGSSGST